MNDLNKDLKEINRTLVTMSRTLTHISKSINRQEKRMQWNPYCYMPVLNENDILEDTFECYHPQDGMIYTFKKGIFEKREAYNRYLERLEKQGRLDVRVMHENFPVR